MPQGSVGMEVIHSLRKIDRQLDLYAGVRDINADRIGLMKLQRQISPI